MRVVTLITTGGTIEKTFNETSGAMENTQSVVHRMLRRLRLEDTEVRVTELMSKDSLLMTDEDRALIVRAVAQAPSDSAGVVILHGTDTLDQTGERLAKEFPSPRTAIVLTGAMRPFEMTRSDAVQNLTEAVFAAGVLAPGVYCVAHGRALRFPGVIKDRERRTFVKRV